MPRINEVLPCLEFGQGTAVESLGCSFPAVWGGNGWKKRGFTVSPLEMAAAVCSCGYANAFFENKIF